MKPNWNLFLELIEHDLTVNPVGIGNNINRKHIDIIVYNFTDTILKAADIAIGLKPASKEKLWKSAAASSAQKIILKT